MDHLATALHYQGLAQCHHGAQPVTLVIDIIINECNYHGYQAWWIFSHEVDYVEMLQQLLDILCNEESP